MQTELVLYGRRKLAAVTGSVADLPPPSNQVDWGAYERLLGQWGEREDVLSCIFVRVRGDVAPPAAYYAARPLVLEREALFPSEARALPTAGQLQELHQDFENEYRILRQYVKESDPRFFDAFCHLFYRWAWALPCDYGEPGISLYEQWKAVAALLFASRGGKEPAKQFTLVGGDIPGIQDFVYTITSKGAAKGLRGRSLFIQLLGDAVVRRLQADLQLSAANVIYNAGGNFLLLAPEDAQAVVERVHQQVNSTLTEGMQGDATLALECMAVDGEALFRPGGFAAIRDEFGQQIAWAKNRPLRELALANQGWQKAFTSKDKGSALSCAVCHIEVDENSSKPLQRTGEPPEGTETPRICYLCDSFSELARAIAKDNLWLIAKPLAGEQSRAVEPSGGWQQLLAHASGFWYEFTDILPEDITTALAVNRPDFLTAPACGLRLLANVTPTVKPEDLAYLRDKKTPAEQIPEEGDVRSFTLLAHAAAQAGAIERVGVLRMDVDGLGAAFGAGMPDMTLPALSAMSCSLERFFNGYLNRIVEGTARNDLYIIYAGGDDLFVVGAWQALPELAEAIHNEFKAFTDNHPALSLSGGITLEGARFPLYRAAERAGEAEVQAKRYTRPDGHRKDALSFLGMVVGWEDWPLVERQKDDLLWLIGERDNPDDKSRLPRTLLQLLQRVHELYREDLAQARRRARQEGRKLPDPRLFFGRWMWAHVYYLTRLARRSEKDLPEAPARIQNLQKEILQPQTVRYSGLAARWAEYLTRKEET